MLGGWVADRFGRWWSYFSFGVALALTAFNGWVHDRYGGVWMLNGEALLALVFVAGGLIVLQRINASRANAVLP